MKSRLIVRLILILVFADFSWTSEAQNPEPAGLLHKKYAQYKQRFYHQFIWKTRQNVQGSNIPLSVRIPRKGQLRWGDATIQLASYISVLATEYALPEAIAGNKDSTLENLYMALLALQRLDRQAEPFFGQAAPDSTINGFFIRDDIDQQILSKKNWEGQYARIHSDYIQGISTNEMSQDQVWHLLLALRLVSELVDNPRRFNFITDKGRTRMTLAEWSGLMAVLMVRQMQQEYRLRLPFSNRPVLKIEYWKLKNPVLQQPVHRGVWPTALKYGFAESANQISDFRFGDCHWANSARSANWFKVFKSGQHLYQLTQGLHKKDMYYAGALACASGQWSANDFVRMQRIGEKLPGGTLRFEHFALMAALFCTEKSDLLYMERDTYLHLLMAAPETGPENKPDKSYSKEAKQWTSISRLIWPERLGSGMPPRLQGEYNGLDFMLLHNLYFLVF